MKTSFVFTIVAFLTFLYIVSERSIRAGETTISQSAKPELPDGYEFELRADNKTYQLLTEWAFQERLCCPFFDIDLRLDREGGPLWLRLTGRPGTKEFIKEEFGI